MARSFFIFANFIRLHIDVRTGESLVDILDGIFDKLTGEFTFRTDKFSTYAIAYTDRIVVTGVTLTQDTATLTKAGETVQLTATVCPSVVKMLLNKEDI